LLQFGLRRLQPVDGGLGFRDPGAPENDDRGLDAMLLKDQFGLEQLELQAHGTQLVSEEKIRILKGQPVAGRLALGRAYGFAGNPGVFLG
jgi:hypothetical protein